jgi:hypothetical protein
MRRLAACLLVAAGIGSAGYCADKALLPLVTSCFDITTDMSELIPDLIPDRHFKNRTFVNPDLDLFRKWRTDHENAGTVSTKLLFFDQLSDVAALSVYRGSFPGRTSALRHPYSGDLFECGVLCAV